MSDKTIKMPKVIADKWLTALRSGEYMQICDVLYDAVSGGYCCLGVLQHCVSGKVWSAPDYNYELPHPDWLKEHGIEFKSHTGSYSGADALEPWLPKLHQNATDANDKGKSFATIADAIEDAMETY